MRKAYIFILILLAFATGVSAQELVGKITDADSAATVLYPAEVTQSQAGKVLATYKTFFDGTFHLKVKSGQTYQIKASYPGRRDSTVSITVDKNGTLVAGTLFISLRKDGLRLMGYVIDRDEDIPIKEAGITIRNVMTRMEDKYFTDVNGYYNLKMDFETNYTFRIDKRSPGIMNKYQDTSFNISTIGFNQPLDFKLDVRLGPAPGVIKVRPEYDPYSKPDNKNLKPVVQVLGKKDSIRLRDQAAALDELNRKLYSKDSAIASIDQKLKDIDLAKKNESTALYTSDGKKREEADAAVIRQEQERKDAAAAEQKRKDEEAAQARLQERSNRENAAIAHADSILLADRLRKEQKAKELAATKQAKEDEQKLIEAALTQKYLDKMSKKENKREAKQQAEEKHRQEGLAAAKVKQQVETQRALAELAIKNQEDSIRRQQDEIMKVRAASEQKRKSDEALLAKKQTNVAITKTDQAKINKENAAIAKADSLLLADKKKKEQKARESTALKKAQEEAALKPVASKQEIRAKEKLAKLETKRRDKELAEQIKIHKQAEEETQAILAKQQREEGKQKANIEQQELEAKKAKAEQEKKNLISQREKLISNQQASLPKEKEKVVKEPTVSVRSIQEQNRKKDITAWEQKVKDENQRKIEAGTISLNTPKGVVRVIKTKGIVKNGQTEDPLANVSINIRRLNSIVSQEVTSDANGNYTFLVDSGYFYLISFYKDKYEISKQILDLTSYSKAENTLLIQYLKEHDEFDPNARMPAIKFEKNSSKLPVDLWTEMEPIVKMMKDVPALKIKIYGLSSADEDYPMELSITRARLVADIMLESGIKPSRIRINGVGAFRPRSGCVEGKACTQEQYKTDRIVMYSVVKE